MCYKAFSPPRSPSSPLFARLKILNIFDLVKVLNLLLVHQFFNLKLPTDFHTTFSFTKLNHPYPTRGRNLGLLQLPKINTKSYGENSMCKQAIIQWNHFQHLYPNLELVNITLSKLKSLVTACFLAEYT